MYSVVVRFQEENERIKCYIFFYAKDFKNKLLDWKPTISEFSIANVYIHLKIDITSLPISDAHVVIWNGTDGR